MIMMSKRLIGIVFTIAFLLLIPLVARFSWTRLDFMVTGVLLLGTGLGCELVLMKVIKIEYRIALCGAVLSVLVLN